MHRDFGVAATLCSDMWAHIFTRIIARCSVCVGGRLSEVTPRQFIGDDDTKMLTVALVRTYFNSKSAAEFVWCPPLSTTGLTYDVSVGIAQRLSRRVVKKYILNICT
jgi:hypothetical protein